jgi:hypothetical protein
MPINVERCGVRSADETATFYCLGGRFGGSKRRRQVMSIKNDELTFEINLAQSGRLRIFQLLT